jgi:probable DNA metabolism protein
MLIYDFDGSFEGLLTALYQSSIRKEKPDQILPRQGLEVNWLDQYVTIETDLAAAEKVVRSIRSRISEQAYEHILHVFQSERPERGFWIDRYVRLGFRLGAAVDDHLQENIIRIVHEQSRRVSRETHRMTGLIRFIRSSSGIYYAKYEPDHNITMFLAPHFADRLADQSWIIHDIRRGIAALYNKKEWILTDSVPAALASWTDCDDAFEDIWRTYHRQIAITERTNPRLQKNLMPLRYWKHLTEFTVDQAQTEKGGEIKPYGFGFPRIHD